MAHNRSLHPQTIDYWEVEVSTTNQNFTQVNYTLKTHTHTLNLHSFLTSLNQTKHEKTPLHSHTKYVVTSVYVISKLCVEKFSVSVGDQRRDTWSRNTKRVLQVCANESVVPVFDEGCGVAVFCLLFSSLSLSHFVWITLYDIGIGVWFLIIFFNQFNKWFSYLHRHF